MKRSLLVSISAIVLITATTGCSTESRNATERPPTVVVVQAGSTSAETDVLSLSGDNADSSVAVPGKSGDCDAQITPAHTASDNPQVECCNTHGWGRWLIRTIIGIAAFWLTLALAACLLLWWLVGTSSRQL